MNNNLSGPDGVAAHGRWVYAGDGDSTLKVIDLNHRRTQCHRAVGQHGRPTRLDEMALTSDGKLLLGANNAEDPPFATLFNANGDNATSNVTKITKVTVDPTIIPTGAAYRSNSRPGIRRPSASTRRSRSSPTIRRAAIMGSSLARSPAMAVCS